MIELLRASLKRPYFGKLALFAASAIIALLIYLFGQVACWHDSNIYTLYAQFLFNPLARFQVADRDPAYPFLLWLTGYTQTHSLKGVLIAQSIMAASMPLLVCLTLETLSAPLGLVVGWVALASGIPFALQTQLFTDELHMFLLMALSLAAVRGVFSARPLWLYGVFLLTGLLIFCRPTYWTLVPLVFACAGLWAVKRHRAGQRWAAHLLAVVILLSALFGFNLWERDLPSRKFAEMGLPPLKTTFAGRQLMENAYRFGGGLEGVYDDHDGPATREFVRRSVLAFADCPKHFQDNVHCLGLSTVHTLEAEGRLGEATKDAETTFRTFFYYPRYLGWFFYIGMLAPHYWETKEDETLLAHVYMEQMTHHPLMLLHMLETGLSELVLTSYYTYNIDDDYGYEPYNSPGSKIPQIEFMPALIIQSCRAEPEMIPYEHYRYMSPELAQGIQHLFEVTYRPLTMATGVGFILAGLWYAVMLLRSRKALAGEATAFLLLFGIYWLPNMVMVMMVMMQFRYQACTALFPLMGTGMFVRRLWLDYCCNGQPKSSL